MFRAISSPSRPASEIALFFLLLATTGCQAGLPSVRSNTASPQAASQSATTRKASTPYTGDLSIFDYKGREEKLQINRVMDTLDIQAGSTVADIGAGSGWFTVQAAKRIGPFGLVYAVDINPAAIAYVQQRAKREGLQNVQTILGADDDPLLPAGSIDSVLLLKTYHEVAQPVRLLENLRKSLRPRARVGIIDRNGKGDNHGIGQAVVVEEAGRAGYVLVEQYDFVKGDGEDYFLVFRPR